MLRRRAAVHFPSGNGPPPCMRHRLTADECPHWDSNPEHKDFKSSVSANWTMGAHPASSEHKHLLFHENAPEPKRKHISNVPRAQPQQSPCKSTGGRLSPAAGEHPGTKTGGAEDRSPPHRPLLYLTCAISGGNPESSDFRALPSGGSAQYRLPAGTPGAGSAGGESRRCRDRKSGSEPRWSSRERYARWWGLQSRGSRGA